MTISAVAHSSSRETHQAACEVAAGIQEIFKGESPDALIIFASSRHDHGQLLKLLNELCRPKIMLGSSSAGEFTTHAYDEGAVSAIALGSPEMHFKAVIGRNLRDNRKAAAQAMFDSFDGMTSHEYHHRSALVLTDALAGHADDLVERLTTLTAGTYQLFGGGAGDDANFTRTHVFFGTEVVPDAAVALEILSHKPIGIGVHHSWEPATPALRVTEAEGMRLVSVNNLSAVEMFEDYAEKTQQKFDRKDPIPFFLHNVIGIVTPGGHKLRVPLGVNADSSIQCAADVPVGSMIHIMSPRGGSTAAATANALQNMQGGKPKLALFFDCVATRLRLGQGFTFELDSLRQKLGEIGFAGCNTYGQIARAEGQFSGFHNCTAVVAIIPD